jgi:hypothetical protein
MVRRVTVSAQIQRKLNVVDLQTFFPKAAALEPGNDEVFRINFAYRRTRIGKENTQLFGSFPKGLPVSCRCHMNGEKNYKKRVKKEMRRKI